MQAVVALVGLTAAALDVCAAPPPSELRASPAAPATSAETPPGRPLPEGVVDQSFALPDGERVLQLTTVVDGAPVLAWRAFTTTDGFTAWAVALARVDLRVGGEIESSYDPKVPLGSGRTIRNAILAFVPERVLVIRNVQAPPNVPFDASTFQELQTAVLFEPVDPAHTRVTVINGGYRDGERYAGVYRHFLAGNAYTLAELRKYLAQRVAGNGP